MKNEMSELLGHVNQLNRNLIESGWRMTDVMLRAQSQLIRQQLAFAEVCINSGIGQLRALGNAKDATDLIGHQARHAANISECVAASVQDLFDLQNETGEELVRVMEDGVAEASDNPLLSGMPGTRTE